MPYTIDRYQLTVSGWPVSVNDKSKDTTSTSLSLIGRYFIGWGESLNENFVHLLENFAGPNPPSNPITGQVWYDTNDNTLKVYDENTSSWTRINASFGTTLPTSASEGDVALILNASEKAIYRYDGTNWIPVYRLFLSNSTPSVTPYDGDLWYDTGTGDFNIYYGGSWNNLSSGGGGGGGAAVERIVHTTLAGIDVFVIDADDQVIGIYSPTNIASSSLGTYTTVKSGSSINLSSLFPNGVKAGFNASPIFTDFIFQSDINFGTSTPNKIEFVVDNQTYMKLDNSTNRVIFPKKLRIYTSGSEYFDTPSNDGEDGSLLAYNATTKETYWETVSALASSVSTIITDNSLKIQPNKIKNQIVDWPSMCNLLLFYFKDNGYYWEGELTSNLTPFKENISVTAVAIHHYDTRTIGLPSSAKRLKIIGGSLLSFHCVDEDNQVFMFGVNSKGQLGIGNTSSPIREWTKSSNLPTKDIKEIIKTGTNISTSKETTFAWFEDGDLYACGENQRGTCGVESSDNVINTFTQCRILDTSITALSFPIFGVKQFSFGFGEDVHAVAYVSAGSLQKVYATGRNNKGQLGIGNTTDQNVFVPVVGLPTLTPSNKVKTIKTGGMGEGSPSTPYTMILLEDGTLWATGYNGQGNLGLGNTTDVNSFVQTGAALGTITNVWCTVRNANTFVEVFDGTNYTYYGTGKNNNGALGIGSTSQQNSWVAISPLNTQLNSGERVIKFISCSKDNSPVLCWTNQNRVFVTGTNANVFLGAGASNLTSFSLVPLPYFEGNIINAYIHYRTNTDPGLVVLLTDKDYMIYGGRLDNINQNIFVPGNHLKFTSAIGSSTIYNFKGMFSAKLPKP